MVWHKIKHIIMICALAVLLAVPASASAYEVYTDGNISSTYTSIFRDLISKKGFAEDYVFFRSRQYEYVLLIGDLEYTSGEFTGASAREYRIIASTDYSSVYTYTMREVTDVSLSPGTALIYSNLGHYPDLINFSDYLVFAQVFLLFLYLCLFLIVPVMRFPNRRRY